MVLYITENGKKIASLIKKRIEGPIVIKQVKSGDFRDIFKDAFESYDSVIAIMATGIVVRGIAPYIKDKYRDPSVIVIDEKGRFVISLLSGHIGGGNELAIKVAERIGAIPVITTASDLNNYPSIDIYAERNGYTISNGILYKRLVMSMLKGEKIAVYLEEDEAKEFFNREPFIIFNSLEDFRENNGEKIYVGIRRIADDVVHLIPKRLVLGMGFHRGVGADELFQFISDVFEKESLWLSAVSKIATIDKREGEKGLKELEQKMGVKTIFFSEDEIKKIDKFIDSKVVLKYHRVGNISETCAYLGSNRGDIVVPKVKGGKITLCIAKERYS